MATPTRGPKPSSKRSLITPRNLAIGAGFVVMIGAIILIGSSSSQPGQQQPTTPPPTSSAPPSEWICSNQGPNFIDMRSSREEQYPMTIDPSKDYFADISTSCGTLRVALRADRAPVAVNNFVHLAKDDFYNGMVFHRIDDELGIIQAGDPGCPVSITACGSGGPGYTIPDEHPNGLRPKVGSVAMARSLKPNTAGSQFEIVASKKGIKAIKDRTIFGELQGQHSRDVAAVILSMPTKENPAATAAGVLDAPTDFPDGEFVYILGIKVEAN